MTHKENVSYLLRLRSSRYRQTPYNHLRVKAHAIGVSILAFTLGLFLILAKFRRTRIKADASTYMLISHCYVTIGGTVLLVQHYLSLAKIVN